MKYFILILFIFATQLVSCQEFVTQLFFEDAIGNKDTIEVGFDENATDTVDVEFGEINIIETPLDRIFDVRITNEWDIRNGSFQTSLDTFHLKKQIAENSCNKGFEAISVDIKAKHYPVKIECKSSDFLIDCIKGSVFTSVVPGGWWDTDSQSDLYRIVLAQESEKTFSANFEGPIYGSYAYISNNDTLSVFWLVFADSRFVATNIRSRQDDDLMIYPNPFRDNFQIVIPNQNAQINSITMYNSIGKKILNESSTNNTSFRVNAEKLGSGLYFIHVKTTGVDYYSSILKK